MKYLKIMLISLLINPLSVYAYSDYVVLGGDNIGININSNGLLITGFYKVNNKYNYNDLVVGDYISHVNGIEVNSVNDFIDIVSNKDCVNLTIRRDDKEFNVVFDLINNKSGLYLKDGITGIGTLTYVDPESRIYGALGHEVIESNTRDSIDIESGSIFESKVVSIDKSFDGRPGTKNAKFYYKNKYGDIDKNTVYGIYGDYNGEINANLIEVGKSNDLKLGKAYIYTTIDDFVDSYEINITKIDMNNFVKNIYFEIVDKELLETTGGIVQGMSGSPIVQDNKLYGAVTHVVVDDVKRGYGVFITTMLEEGEK